MDSKRVQVRAKGHADIMQNTLDVTSSVKLPRAKTAAEKIFDEPVYVRVHGPFDALQYELDKDKLKASTTDVLKEQAKAKLDAEKQRLINEAKAKADAEKQRLKEKADEEKRRAEEKARQKLKESTDKYEDKLKDKLKGLF
jgi:cell division ATPase FtsA